MRDDTTCTVVAIGEAIGRQKKSSFAQRKLDQLLGTGKSSASDDSSNGSLVSTVDPLADGFSVKGVHRALPLTLQPPHLNLSHLVSRPPAGKTLRHLPQEPTGLALRLEVCFARALSARTVHFYSRGGACAGGSPLSSEHAARLSQGVSLIVGNGPCLTFVYICEHKFSGVLAVHSRKNGASCITCSTGRAPPQPAARGRPAAVSTSAPGSRSLASQVESFC